MNYYSFHFLKLSIHSYNQPNYIGVSLVLFHNLGEYWLRLSNEATFMLMNKYSMLRLHSGSQLRSGQDSKDRRGAKLLILFDSDTKVYMILIFS